MSNIPKEGLRWDLRSAAAEFSCSVETLRKRLIVSKEVAGEDRCFSTGQLLRASFGSIHVARLTEIEERGQNWKIRNSALRAELLDRQALTQGLGAVFVAIRQIVTSSTLPPKEKTDLLNTIAGVPVIVKNVAQRQVKQLRGVEPAEESEAEVGG